MKKLAVFLLLLSLLSCGPDPFDQKCAYKKGDIVEIKISGEKGMVTKLCGACDCRYLVRFHSAEGYYKEYFRDFEVVAPERKVEFDTATPESRY
jgi:hypothetical protein